MNIFENNITILEKKYPEIARKIKEINMESTTDQVRIQKAGRWRESNRIILSKTLVEIKQ